MPTNSEILHYHRPGWYVSWHWRFEAEHTGPDGTWEVSDGVRGGHAFFARVPSLRAAERWCEERIIAEYIA